MLGFGKYPLIGYLNPAKPDEGRIDVFPSLVSMGWNYATGAIANSISNFLDEQEKKSRKKERKSLWDIATIYLSGLLKKSSNDRIGKADKIYDEHFPLLGVLSDLTDGSTDGEEFYTAGFEGKESTVYVRKKNESEPTDEQIASNVDLLKKNRYSPYQEGDKINTLFRSGFINPGIDFITGGDYSKQISNKTHAHEWFVRDEMYYAQQRGEQLEFSDKSRTKTIGGLVIRKYARPTKIQSFANWGLKKFINYTFNLPSKATELMMPEAANDWTQYLWELKYKIVSWTERALIRNSSRLEHDLDFRDAEAIATT